MIHIEEQLKERLSDTSLSDNELKQYVEQYPEDVKTMTNFAERFMQQGMQRGEAAMLLRQMERKFGILAPETRQRIIEADAETLLAWSDRILTAQTPEEVLH
jgi:ADP-dependent phosphofructokinase/glucokinase